MLLDINATIEWVLCDSLYKGNYVWLESDLYYAPGKIVPRNVRIVNSANNDIHSASYHSESCEILIGNYTRYISNTTWNCLQDSAASL